MATCSLRHRRSPVGRAVAMVCLGVTLVAPPLWAQSADTTLPTVVITERSPAPAATVLGLDDTPLAQTPASVHVLDAQRIESSGARRLADLIKFDASVTDAYNATGYWDYTTVRGYVLDNQFNYRREGLPINAETAIALDNKAQVEVLKGTSGMQAGTSAPGGLVQYTVKRPTAQALRSVRLEATDTGGVLASVDLSDHLGADSAWAYRLNAADEHITSPTPHANGQRQLLALALDWRQSANTLVQAEVEYSRRAQPSVPGLSLLGNALPPADPNINLGAQPWTQPVVLQGLTASLKLDQRLSADWRLLAQWGTQRLLSQDRSAFPFGCSAADGSYYADRYCPNGNFDLYDYRSENEHRNTNAQQIQLQGQLSAAGMLHKLGLGLTASQVQTRYQAQAYNYVGTVNLFHPSPVAPDPSLTGTNTQRTEHQVELAANDHMAITPQWGAWLGVRHTELQRSSVQTDGSAATTYRRSLNTPWLALSYQLTPQHMLYASAGRGVESVVVPSRDLYQNKGQTLPPVVARQSEVGLKAQGRDGGWQIAYFDIVRPATNLDACNNVVQSLGGQCTAAFDGSDEHRGLEADAQWRTGAWTLGASASLMDARRHGSLMQAQYPDVAALQVNGQHPTNVPRNVLRAQADYRVASLPGLSVQALWSHEGQRSALPDGSITLPAWNRLDGSLRYDTALLGAATTWALGITNLSNARFLRESPNQYGHVYLFPELPRQFRVSVQAKF